MWGINNRPSLIDYEKFKLSLLLLTALFFVKNVTRGHKYNRGSN